MGTLYFKVLKDGASFHGGGMAYSLPALGADGVYAPGDWHEVAGQLELCHCGLHLTRDPKCWWASGAVAYVAEWEGESLSDGDDKICVAKCRLLRPATVAEMAAVGIYLEGRHEQREGFALASGSSTVEASGSSTVRAYDSTTVRASGSATVRASGSATVLASGSSTVEASGSSTVEASGSSTVRAYDSTTVRAYGSSTVLAYGSAMVQAFDSATVLASGSATVRAYGSATVRAYDSTTVRALDSATVEAYGSATVEAYGSAVAQSTRWHDASAPVSVSGAAVHIDRRKAGIVTVRAGGDVLSQLRGESEAA